MEISMPKVLEDVQSGSGKYHGDGIFTEVIKISKVEDLSNYPNSDKEVFRFESGFQPELCLKVFHETESKSDKERFTIFFGKLKYEVDKISGKKGKYLGWDKKYNAIQSFLARLLGAKAVINDNDQIADSTLLALIGKEFVKLRYCIGPREDADGKPGFQDYQFIQPNTEEGNQLLLKQFKASAVYIKKYNSKYFDNFKESDTNGDDSFNPSEYSDDVI
jgi:hypothetical protein